MQSAVKDVGLCCDKVSTYLVVVFSALLSPIITTATVTDPPQAPPFWKVLVLSLAPPSRKWLMLACGWGEFEVAW